MQKENYSTKSTMLISVAVVVVDNFNF